MTTYIITGVLMGLVFGFALEKGRVFEPGVMLGQFQLRNFIMVKMFLSAAATSLIVLGVLQAAGAISLHPKAAVFPAILLGGFIFGGGMALAGACPGTVLAQAGAGYKDAWGVLAGGVLGAMAYGYMEPALAPLNSGPGKITLADVFGAPFWVLAFLAASAIIMSLYALEKWRPWRDDLGEDYDGVKGE